MTVSRNEAGRRRWAAIEACSLWRGGVSIVSRATGMSCGTIYAGIASLEDPDRLELEVSGRCRKTGGGRRSLAQTDCGLAAALDRLVDPATRGDPMRLLSWTCKSTVALAAQLSSSGHPVSARTVAGMLREQGYSLQSVRKTKEGEAHPDRDQQFRYLDRKVRQYQRAEQPVISVDTKKKELVGSFQNKGRNGIPRVAPMRSTSTIFQTRNWEGLLPTESMTLRRTKVG